MASLQRCTSVPKVSYKRFPLEFASHEHTGRAGSTTHFLMVITAFKSRCRGCMQAFVLVPSYHSKLLAFRLQRHLAFGHLSVPHVVHRAPCSIPLYLTWRAVVLMLCARRPEHIDGNRTESILALCTLSSKVDACSVRVRYGTSSARVCSETTRRTR